MKKYICLRDDDTSYFTSPEDLIQAYGIYWGMLPVTLATVPFINGNNSRVIENEKYSDKFKKTREWEKIASVEELTEYHATHPIGLNHRLIAELKKQIGNGKVEIAQHGVNHLYNERGAEMFSDQVGYYAIRAGKEYLEKVFSCNINTFIAPSNTVDRKCSEYIDSLSMNLFCCKISYEDSIDRICSILKSPKTMLEKIKRGKQDKLMPLKTRNGITIIDCVTYGTMCDEDVVYDSVIERLNYSGFVALCTHYYMFNDDQYKRHYQNLLKRLFELEDVEFVTASEYYKLAKEHFYE